MSEITEDDLHAYVDGGLPAERRLTVEAWLAAHPADEARVNAWLAQNRALHETFDEVLNEPLPLDLLRAAGAGRARASHGWRAAAAAAFGIAASAVLGYGVGLHSASAPALQATLPRDAAIAHVVYSPEQRHPVEVDARHADHLVAWLSKRLGHELQAPDFKAQGFELLGGRLLPGNGGPVAQFMYEDGQARRVTLYVRRAATSQEETAFQHAREDGVEVFYWVDRDLGYALSGSIGKAEMGRLADAAYRQIGR